MKYRTTKKAIKETENRIISVNYCNLQFLLNATEPFAYSTRTEGWACDYYEIPRGICVSTGYAPIGKDVSYDLCREYDKKAEQICRETSDWKSRKAKLDSLLEDFAGDIEAKYFSGRRKKA